VGAKYTLRVPAEFVNRFPALDYQFDSLCFIPYGESIQYDSNVTPTKIANEVELYKSELKRQHYSKKTSKENLSFYLPTCVNQLLLTENYIPLQMSFGVDDATMSKNYKLSETEANSIVQRYGARFAESILLFDGYWFFVTSFDLFLHSNPQIDDCADRSKYSYQPKPIGFIRLKTRFGLDYHELTVRFANVEALVTAGFYGNIEKSDINPFCGSALQGLPSDITGRIRTFVAKSIFINEACVPVTTSNRLLNQYYKNHSLRQWCLTSKKDHKNGFFPANPVYFISPRNVFQTSSSLIIRSFALTNLPPVKDLDKLIKAIPVSNLTSTQTLIKNYLLKLKHDRNL
jgi:hypothetical protein